MASTTRTWKVTRQPDAPPPPIVAWSMTIADVVQNMPDAERYRAHVRQWARTTLRELDAVR